MTSHKEKYDHNYEEIDVIGNGAYGTVFKAKDPCNEGSWVAIKRIKIQNTEEGMPMSAIREIALLKQLENYEHPNIVRYCHLSFLKSISIFGTSLWINL